VTALRQVPWYSPEILLTTRRAHLTAVMGELDRAATKLYRSVSSMATSELQPCWYEIAKPENSSASGRGILLGVESTGPPAYLRLDLGLVVSKTDNKEKKGRPSINESKGKVLREVIP